MTPDPDVFYLFAGDLHPTPEKREAFLSQFDGKVFSVLGNHDLYGSHFLPQHTLHEMAVGGVKIAGNTLWTDLSNPLDYLNYYTNLADSRYIAGLTQETYVAMHELQKKALFASGADIFVTHHCPSYLSVDGKYKYSPVNPAFATEMASMIVAMPKPPKLWVHGHTHDEFDYMIGQTRVICHPRGYPSERDDYTVYEPKIIDMEF